MITLLFMFYGRNGLVPRPAPAGEHSEDRDGFTFYSTSNACSVAYKAANYHPKIYRILYKTCVL